MRFLFPLLLLFLWACDDQQEIPADVLERHAVVQMIGELHLGEAMVLNRNLPQDSSVMLYNIYQDSIMEAHGTDTATFHRSFRFYLRDLVAMDEMYAEVIDSLSLRQAELKAKIEKDTVSR